ncbi:hypothetical protein NKR23_g9120 [Pleurostoma richardsiae]|uniref:CFEM domain-containing protein n=1 Tax=Pleurostoma richardsiae TaxID=41990 RepID=A0AA38R7C8_9PEZI|nr:hypothetical protein NKR23_g9120 [Pleurostoma richardsiae]
MKTITLLLAAAASANALSSCILNCQSQEASTSGCDTNYNTTTCYCNNENFAANVKACIYENGCDSDVSVFYEYREEFCGGDEEDGSGTSDTNETIDDQGGVLGSCILGCQTEAATSAGCSSNYNKTSCYCDNDDFATDVKVCLYQNCSTEVTVFYNYRSDICGGDNSTEYHNSLDAGDATAGIASSTVAATAAATTGASTATAGSATASATGSTSGAVREGVVITCLAAAVAFAVYATGL